MAYDNFFVFKSIYYWFAHTNRTILGYLEAGHKINHTKRNLLLVEKYMYNWQQMLSGILLQGVDKSIELKYYDAMQNNVFFLTAKNIFMLLVFINLTRRFPY